MPDGPPPGPDNVEAMKQEEEESEDDIPMPEGPPPPKPGSDCVYNEVIICVRYI